MQGVLQHVRVPTGYTLELISHSLTLGAIVQSMCHLQQCSDWDHLLVYTISICVMIACLIITLH